MKFSFENLTVWQDAIRLSKEIYLITDTYPKEERYGLTSQSRRAVTSIALNIAEGRGRNTTKDYIHFLHISRGSLLELVTCIEIASVLGYIKQDTYQKFRLEFYALQRKISALINSIAKRTSKAQAGAMLRKQCNTSQ